MFLLVFPTVITEGSTVGYSGHTGVPLFTAFSTTHFRCSYRTSDPDRRRLCPHPGHVRGTQEYTRSGLKFQQWSAVSPCSGVCSTVSNTSLNRYNQCEMMSAHYKHPVLLIEWEEHKSFSLEVRNLLLMLLLPSNNLLGRTGVEVLR
jgi:hypothetical protein